MAVRLALLAHHYRSDWDWDDADLDAGAAAPRALAGRRATRHGTSSGTPSTTCGPPRRRPRRRVTPCACSTTRSAAGSAPWAPGAALLGVEL